jgi:hypothetical protein
LNNREKARARTASVRALALELVQDTRFRNRLLSAVGHVIEAGRRTRRDLGSWSVLVRLASDQALLSELRGARRDLEQAYGRVEAKRRTHKKRYVLVVVAALAALTGLPQVRAWLAGLLAKGAEIVRSTPRVASIGMRRSSTESRAPRSLDDLTKEELYARAQEADIAGRSEMSKEQLQEASQERN